MSVPLPRSPRREPAGVPPTKGSRWERFARLVLATYGDTCWLCTHGGARQADHIESVADRPDLAWDLRNCRPAHGAPGNPCLTCTAECGRKVYCNQLRGPMTLERFRRVLAGMRDAHQDAPPQARPKPEPGAGRPW
jgi:hypothetical protein